MAEEVTGLGGVVADIANMMGKKLDQHSLQIDGLRRKFDEQEITLYQHGAVQREHSREFLQLKMQVTNLDGKVEDMAVDIKLILALLTPKATEE